jgi:hypothetical protein
MGSGRVSREGNPDRTCALGKGYYLGWLLTILLRTWFFILLLHGSCLGSRFSLRNVRTCGCPRMSSRILLLGPLPRYFFSVTSTIVFYPTTIANLTDCMRLTSCGERTLPTLPSSRPRIDWHTRSSSCDSLLKVSNRPLWSRVVLNNFDCVCNNALSLLSLLFRTRFYSQRWRT